jgi:hypothetical protein
MERFSKAKTKQYFEIRIRPMRSEIAKATVIALPPSADNTYDMD